MFEYYKETLTIHAAAIYNKPMHDEIKMLGKKVDMHLNEGNQEEFMQAMMEVKVLKNKYKNDPGTFLTIHNYKAYLRKGKLVKLKNGGNGRTALIEWNSINETLKHQIVQQVGYNPEEETKNVTFVDYIKHDEDAHKFFHEEFTKSNGDPLSDEQKKRWSTQANIFNAITDVFADRNKQKSAFGKSIKVLWKNISKIIQNLDADKFPHGLGKNPRRLEEKYKEFIVGGYASLIHKGLDNDNSKKIRGEVSDWLLAMYCLPIKMAVPVLLQKYEAERKKHNWPIFTERAICYWLEKPEVKRVWVLGRHGRKEYEKQFGYHIKRKKDNWFANAWWAIDGSKLDWVHYYDNTLKMAAKLKINPVVDVYSEKIIGWSYSETENMVDHFVAMKMAANTAQARPYLISHDNQSGHKSPKMKELYGNLVAKNGGTFYAHKAYRSSNPIEQIFGRLQQQVLNQMWFSDKQSIKSRSMDSVPNIDFIKDNKHRLMDKEYLIKAWTLCVNQWNEAEHPKFKGMTRNEVFEMEAPMREELDFLDMVELFWINETKPKKYFKGGMPLTVSGNKYEYEVLDKNGRIDIEFRRKYVGAKMIVKYDPEHLEKFVQLYHVDENGVRRFVANAEPKREHEQIPVLKTKEGNEAFHQDYGIIELELQRDLAAIEKLQQRTGITPEKLIDEQELLIKVGGDLPKELRNELESNYIDGL